MSFMKHRVWCLEWKESFLQQEIVKTAHKLEHLGTAKKNQMLKVKYMLASLFKRNMIHQMIRHCYDCQPTTKEHLQEPMKSSAILK